MGNWGYFQLVEKKKCFTWEDAKKVVEGLGTGWFITVTNLAPPSCDCAKTLSGHFFLIMQGFNNFYSNDTTCSRFLTNEVTS